MNYQQQRNLGAKLFPEYAAVILDEGNCFDELFEAIPREQVLACREILPGWAYKWAIRSLGDRELMRPFITEAEWAIRWAAEFPEDREVMRPFVTDSRWAYWWTCAFPEDRKIMRSFITSGYWAYWWAKRFPEDRDYFVAKGLLDHG